MSRILMVISRKDGSTQPREYNWGATWKKKVAAPGLETEITAAGDPQVALTSPTSDGRSVGIVRWRTKATEFVFITCKDTTSSLPQKTV
jgi:hypothetical protein